MRNLKCIKGYLCLLAILLLVNRIEVNAQEIEGVLIDKIIAKVDDYIVLKSELEKSYLDFLSRGELGRGDAKCQIFESLIINKLLVAKAEIDSVEVSDSEVNNNLDRRLNYIVSQIGSEERVEEYYGKTMDQFRVELFEQIKEQLIIQKMQGEITSDISVTPAEVKRFFNLIPKDSLPFFSTEVAIGQIVKIPEVSKSQKDKIKGDLLDIRDRIVAGIDFEDMARKYSADPGSRGTGGNLGFFKRGELAPEYEATALGLKPGEISMPVESQFGIHLIQLIERRGNSYNSRHILMNPMPSVSDVQRAKDFLDSLRTLVLNDSLKFQNAAKEYSDDPITAGSGGFFTDANGAARVSVEELDPVVFFTIDTMQVGNITRPMEFRMDDGKDALRVLWYKERIAPHQANILQDYQKIRSATLASKRNKNLQEWFNKAKDDVFIDIDEEYQYCDILKD